MKEFCMQARLCSPAGACLVCGNSLSCNLVMVHLSVGTFKAVECWKPVFIKEKQGKQESKREEGGGEKEGEKEG